MIRLAQPRINPRVRALFDEVLASGMLTSGPLVARLEEALSRRLDGRHVVLVSSGTTAALIAFHIFRELGIRRVILPDFSFPSVAASALRVGLDLTLVDIEPERLTLDLRAVARRRPGPHTVLSTLDPYGIPAPMAATAALAKKRGWRCFEDAACALGSHDDGLPCGTRADLAILSFHPRKTLTTAEGGALVTGDAELARQARELRSLGVVGQGLERAFTRLGYNARLSELHAAVGLAHLEDFPRMLAARRALGARYLELLAGVPGIEVPAGYRLDGANFQSMVIYLPPGTDRARISGRLREAGIESTLAGFAIHTQPAFAAIPRRGEFPHSLALHARGLTLPLHEEMTLSDVETVVQALAAALTREKE